VSRLCFLRQIRPLVPPFPPVGTVAAPCGCPAVPHLHRYYGVVRLLVHLSRPPLASLGESVPPMMRGDGGALLGSWEIPVEACPELGTPATPVRPRIIGRPSAAFRLVNGVGIATSRVFGAESSRPASSLCTLRIHQSPDEWQHSLPACLLDCDRAGLTPAGFQQEVSPFHLRFLLFQTFPSAITTSAMSRGHGTYFCNLEHTFPVSACALVCLRECRSCFDDFVSNRMARAPLLHHCGGVAHQTSLRSRSIMMCYANSPPCGEAGSLFS
jgi:hypothetical protein